MKQVKLTITLVAGAGCRGRVAGKHAVKDAKLQIKGFHIEASNSIDAGAGLQV